MAHPVWVLSSTTQNLNQPQCFILAQTSAMSQKWVGMNRHNLNGVFYQPIFYFSLNKFYLIVYLFVYGFAPLQVNRCERTIGGS